MNFFVFFDKTFDKNRLKRLLRWTYYCQGLRKALELSERLKDLGFRIVSKAGLSLGTEDLLIPKEKCWSTRLAEKRVKKSKTFERIGALNLL